MLNGKNILLVISGGIAAYKSLELIRLMRQSGAGVRCILTAGGAQFVTPLSVAALSENPVHTDLWSLKDETEMGHIRLSREADLIVVAPASADFLAKLANGLADDLASTTLLAANAPILFAPAMNHVMWENPITQDNVQKLLRANYAQIGPNAGDMACGETGLGRMAEPEEILENVLAHFNVARPLKGKTALVTAGPTHEPLDPVRYIANRSSGKQGYAIAKALHEAGADVTLLTGPTTLAAPKGIKTIRIETAEEMHQEALNALPCDIAVCAAAVADWCADAPAQNKIKKRDDASPPQLSLRANPDIVAALCAHAKRPKLVIGFAAETENVIENARAKRLKKGCDWICANDVSKSDSGFSADMNRVTLITQSGMEDWPQSAKEQIARTLVTRIADHFNSTPIPYQEAAE